MPLCDRGRLVLVSVTELSQSAPPPPPHHSPSMSLWDGRRTQDKGGVGSETNILSIPTQQRGIRYKQQVHTKTRHKQLRQRVPTPATVHATRVHVTIVILSMTQSCTNQFHALDELRRHRHAQNNTHALTVYATRYASQIKPHLKFLACIYCVQQLMRR